MVSSLLHSPMVSNDAETSGNEEDSQDEEEGEEEEEGSNDEDSELGERDEDENRALKGMDAFSDCSGAGNLDEVMEIKDVFDVEAAYGKGVKGMTVLASKLKNNHKKISFVDFSALLSDEGLLELLEQLEKGAAGVECVEFEAHHTSTSALVLAAFVKFLNSLPKLSEVILSIKIDKNSLPHLRQLLLHPTLERLNLGTSHFTQRSLIQTIAILHSHLSSPNPTRLRKLSLGWLEPLQPESALLEILKLNRVGLEYLDLRETSSFEQETDLDWLVETVEKNKTIQCLWLRPRDQEDEDEEEGDDGIDFDESRNDINAYLQRNRDLRQETHDGALHLLSTFQTLVNVEPSTPASSGNASQPLPSTGRQASLSSFTAELLAATSSSPLSSRQQSRILKWASTQRTKEEIARVETREWLESVDCWRWEAKAGRV